MNEKLEYAIREIYAKLRKSEKRTADYLLNYKGTCSELTLEKIADEAGVSQPTVLRFIKAMGYKGFKEFRYVLAREQEISSNSEILSGFSIKEQDQISELPGKIIGTSIEQLKDTLKYLSQEKLKEVIEVIKTSDKVAIYYVENSACTAIDLATKLMYLGINSYLYSDYYMQIVSASNLSETDTAIGISYSGCSKNTVDVMREAQKAGAKTIAITNYDDTLISDYADLVLSAGNKEFVYGNAIFSRISQLAVVDMIYTGMILSDFQRYSKILDKSSKLIGKMAYDRK